MSVEENKSEEKGIKMIVFGRKIDFLSLFCEKIINFVRAYNYNVAKCNIANIQNKQEVTNYAILQNKRNQSSTLEQL